MFGGTRWLACVCFRYSTRIGRCGWLLGLTCLLSATCGAQEASETNSAAIQWRTGADLKKHLDVVTSVQWQDAELRSRLQNLAAGQRVAIFLDRRIDPQQKIDLSITGTKLDVLLDQLAQQVNAATSPIDSVMYIGPPRTAQALSGVLRQRRKEVSRHAALARARPERWSWDELAEPRQLMVALLRRHQLTVVNPEAIPHDLWPAADLPPLGLADRLTLLLAGFDLTFEISTDGRQLRLIPMPLGMEHEPVVRRPGSEGTTAKEPTKENTRYTLTVMNQSAGAVVNKVAERLELQLKCSDSVRQKLSTKINLKVSDVSLEELMEKTLEPLGLTYHLTKETLDVVVKDP